MAQLKEDVIIRIRSQQEWDQVIQRLLDMGIEWYSGGPQLHSEYYRNNTTDTTVVVQAKSHSRPRIAYGTDEFNRQHFPEAYHISAWQFLHFEFGETAEALPVWLQ